MMKLRTTTPASLSRYTKRAFLVVFALVLIGTGVGYNLNRSASADQYDDKIRALQADMANYQAEANRLNAEASSLANALAQIKNEKNAILAQIAVSQAQYDKLVIEIADTEKKIGENQDALGLTIADLYLDDDISPVEMLASSQNIGDFLDKQEYRNSVKDELSSTIKTVKDLKTQLTTQKEEVTKVLATQQTARDSLQAKENEQASVLAQTQNDESKYQNMIKSSQTQIAEAKRAQAVLNARTNSTGGYTLVDAGSLTAYPWNSSNCAMLGYLSTGGADGNGGDGRGYGCRQCASYVAWRIARETGIYYRWGNGGMFSGNAIANGYQNLGSSPQPGSIAVIWGNPGHVAWVEAVSGNQVLVSQYNYNYGAGWGMYSEMWLSVNFFDQYVKIT
jgi:surface antigen